MTWLAVDTPSSSTDLDALLALNPEAGKTLRDFLAIAAMRRPGTRNSLSRPRSKGQSLTSNVRPNLRAYATSTGLISYAGKRQ